MVMPAENLRRTYLYWDKRSRPPALVFSCQAPTILEADRLYKEATKQDPVKQPWVGCERVEE